MAKKKVHKKSIQKNISKNKKNILTSSIIVSLLLITIFGLMATGIIGGKKNCKTYLKKLNNYVKSIDNDLQEEEAKNKIVSKVYELSSSYNKIDNVDLISTQIVNNALNNNFNNTQDLKSIINSNIDSIIKNIAPLNFLKPNKTVNIQSNSAANFAGSNFNVKLNANIYFANVDKNGNPTSNKWVYLIHGFAMDGKAMANAVGKMYLDQGINIIATDQRGFGSSKGSMAMGYLESLDAWDWLTYLNNNYKPSQIVVHGLSMGAATTIYLSGININGQTLKNKNVVGLVEDCGYSSMISLVDAQYFSGNGGESLKKLLGIVAPITGSIDSKRLILDQKIGLNENNFDELQNGVNSIAKANVPFLIIHGTKDTIVPFDNSTNIYNAAINNKNIPFVDRYVAEGQPHAFIVLGIKYNDYKNYIVNFSNKVFVNTPTPNPAPNDDTKKTTDDDQKKDDGNSKIDNPSSSDTPNKDNINNNEDDKKDSNKKQSNNNVINKVAKGISSVFKSVSNFFKKMFK